jgi:cation diffusion facilitator family transporter
MQDHAHEYEQASRVTWIGMAVNAVLGVAKVVCGVLGNSWAVIADGLHTISDLASSIAILVGLRVAKSPPDARHPYGHGKAEVLSARIVAFLLFVVGGFILHEAFSKLFFAKQIAIPSQIALWAALASIVVKEALYRYKEYYAKKTRSSALHADAWHHRSDALTSLAALVGVGAAILGGGRLNWVDPVAAIVVACVILWITLKVFTSTMGELMDAAPPEDVLNAIRDLAGTVEGVRSVEQIRCRKAGLNYLVDIHVEVDPGMRVDDAHAIASSVRDKLVNEGEDILQALVHIEPYYPDDH